MGFHELNTNLSSRQVYLDSKDANYYINESNSEPVWIFNEHIICPDYASMLISVVDVQIPASMYNIDGVNNTLQYILNGVSQDPLVIPQGNYNVMTLKDYLNANLTGFTVTYDDTLNGFTFSGSASFQFQATSTCFNVLGLSSKNHDSSVNKLTSDIPIDLAGLGAIYIMSDLLTRNMDTRSGTLSHCICKVPVLASNFGIITYINYTNFKSTVTTRNLQQFHLTLEDENRNVIDLNGHHWQITLQVDFIKDIIDPRSIKQKKKSKGKKKI
jgi:hypothetical protein